MTWGCTKPVALGGNFIEVRLGVDSSPTMLLGGLVGDPGLGKLDPLVGLPTAALHSILSPLFPGFAGVRLFGRGSAIDD